MANTSRRPGFDYVRTTSRHENIVLGQGYAWVQTNTLADKWTNGITDDTTPDNIASQAPDCLRPHGHHGPNTHRIVKGALTLTSVDPHTNRKVSEVTISEHGRRDAPVAANVFYDGRTPETAGCTFVEGHKCLSPRTALRYMRGGTLGWFDAEGDVVSEADQKYVMEQLEKSRTVELADNGVSFRMRGRKPVARDMQAWFDQEWQDIAELKDDDEACADCGKHR